MTARTAEEIAAGDVLTAFAHLMATSTEMHSRLASIQLSGADRAPEDVGRDMIAATNSFMPRIAAAAQAVDVDALWAYERAFDSHSADPDLARRVLSTLSSHDRMTAITRSLRELITGYERLPPEMRVDGENALVAALSIIEDVAAALQRMRCHLEIPNSGT